MTSNYISGISGGGAPVIGGGVAVSGGGGGCSVNTLYTSVQQPFRLNQIEKFNVEVRGQRCDIVKDSDLYFKIVDTISGFIILADNDDIINHGNNFSRSLKQLLERELLVNVEIIKIDTFKSNSWNLSFEDELVVGVSLNIDQTYINNYRDVETQQLIKMALTSSSAI
jgi:hypothetical protein